MLQAKPEQQGRPGDQNYPLSGITVIDLSHVYNGPYATFLMAMAGAEVIKVEPHQGEHLRSRGDMGGAALPFAMLNSNKKPVTLNLKAEAGRTLLKEMVARADILVEQQRGQAGFGGCRSGGEAGGSGANHHHIVIFALGSHSHLPISRLPFWISICMPSATGTRQPWRLPTPSMVTRQSKHTPIMQ